MYNVCKERYFQIVDNKLYIFIFEFFLWQTLQYICHFVHFGATSNETEECTYLAVL